MENRKSTNSSFLLGIFVGVIVTLLLVTKKGRKILNMLLEEGKDKVSGWDHLLKEFQEIVDEEEQNRVTFPAALPMKTQNEKNVEQTDSTVVTSAALEQEIKPEKPADGIVQQSVISTDTQGSDVEAPKANRKRLFRGIRRKAS